MIKVTLVTNDGDGIPVNHSIREGTILEDFLNVAFGGDPDDFTIRVRSNGNNVEDQGGYVLQDGDRVSVAPAKVEGAATL